METLEQKASPGILAATHTITPVTVGGRMCKKCSAHGEFDIETEFVDPKTKKTVKEQLVLCSNHKNNMKAVVAELNKKAS